jgi:phospholipid transport system substrate-binding protein
MGKALLAWLLVAAAASPVGSPKVVVESAVARALKALEEARQDGAAEAAAQGQGQERARAEVRRVAEELFDFEEMGRRALARHWEARSPAERREFVALFTDTLERACLDRLADLSGGTVVYTGEAVEGGIATVRSRVFTRQGRGGRIDYRVHLVDGRWKVYDVVVDGVSAVAVYRRQLERVIQSASWEELMARLRRRALPKTTAWEQGAAR